MNNDTPPTNPGIGDLRERIQMLAVAKWYVQCDTFAGSWIYFDKEWKAIPATAESTERMTKFLNEKIGVPAARTSEVLADILSDCHSVQAIFRLSPLPGDGHPVFLPQIPAFRRAAIEESGDWRARYRTVPWEVDALVREDRDLHYGGLGWFGLRGRSESRKQLVRSIEEINRARVELRRARSESGRGGFWGPLWAVEHWWPELADLSPGVVIAAAYLEGFHVEPDGRNSARIFFPIDSVAKARAAAARYSAPSPEPETQAA